MATEADGFSTGLYLHDPSVPGWAYKPGLYTDRAWKELQREEALRRLATRLRVSRALGYTERWSLHR